MKRVLIVGSDLHLREMIASILADIPAEICIVSRLEESAADARHGCFDLVIIIDIAPFFNGSDPVGLLRPEHLRRPEIFIFAWQHSEQTVLSLLECGISQYLTFPINIQRAKRKICETLGYAT